ncbi:hypothetical protein PanWU01x14_053890 [Parasponia andersonii]|uniref:Uncharacterized protein n=1 Tax=Parasponia andersonii TaxID=3476 RepID=A0A2P5DKM4_PARAD|nr:hypothetical protein PanWU01x14_053890 [Parasponia andersonii]
MELTSQNKHFLNGMEAALEPGSLLLFMSPEKHFQWSPSSFWVLRK